MRNDSLDLEKLKIDDRLRSLELQTARLVAHSESEAGNITLVLKRYDENINKLNHIITGNGQPGIAEKVRVLEEADKNRKKHLGLIYGAIVMGFGEWVWRCVGHFIK